MTVDEAKAAMRLLGWTYVQRRRWRKQYVYAEKRVSGRKIEKYISSLTALDGFTVDQLTAKLSS